ncbi:disease resistance protein RPM1-like isoform X1 [Macadamia integrifolia]|uniref:disease resistance protein RPM1-like isoform X1 n=1 Tax=Macadamia integrifolia TaxID=60698 RepID=UPI001C5280B8|nr:disease resistance protein RPM1-like isoform X1 [Macadamia integrifolia]
MAEAFVKSFLQRLSSLKLQENEGSPCLLDQIKKLQNRLEDIANFRREVGNSSKQEDGLISNWESDLIEIVNDAVNCIDQCVAKIRTQDGSDQDLSIAQFCSELEKIDERLAGISSRRSQLDMPPLPTLVAKEEIGLSSSTDVVDVVGEESFAPFALNYRNLPSYLRSCLFYCSLFPGKISRGRLVRLLVAEGILQERPGEVMEDIAEENINELLSQGMLRVEIGYKNELKVVDPYHEICQLELQQGEDSQGLIPGEYWIEGIPDDHWACVRNALHTFNFLRVLEFENLCIKSLPEELGNLIHLRYLGLKHSTLHEIPESIRNLQNLQTLDIGCSRMRLALPSGVLNLLRLRHLMLSMNETKVLSGISTLTNLQSLTGLYLRLGIIEELRSLTQLRKLELKDVSEEHANELSASIMKMRGLVSLSLDSGDHWGKELLPTLELFSPPQFIRKLRLDGCLVDLPHWVCSMEKLTKLRLGFTFLPEEAVFLLQLLPNLKHLTLWEACKVKKMNKEFCRVGGFPKLEALVIASMKLMEWTEIEEGALPSLVFLSFHSCPRLMSLPEGLQYVTTLKELKILPLHPDLERRLKPDGGKENYKIKHIPLIQFLPLSLLV